MIRTRAALQFNVALFAGVLSGVAAAQGVAPKVAGVPEDWSHHRQIFSNPGTYEEALHKGKAAEWLRINNDRRYQVQLLRQSLIERKLAAAPDYAAKLKVVEEWKEDLAHGKNSKNKTGLDKDWSMYLGSTAQVGIGQYPAKYTFATSTANCSDWIAFNTSAPGSMFGTNPGQANVVGYTNLYKGDAACGTPSPKIYWAYYTGPGSTTTSVVPSFDGTKIAFVENSSSGAILRVLEWSSGEGTPKDPYTPDVSFTNTVVGAAGNTGWDNNCPTTASCMFSVAFQQGATETAPPQDAISAPYYFYDGEDTVIVGDSTGYLHKFTGVFFGIPAEVTSSPWPVRVSGNVLTSPVYDTSSSNIFVADSGGYLYSYKAATGAHVMTTSRLTYSNGTITEGIIDAPLVDSTTEKVYVFVGDDANTAGSGNSYTCTNATGCSGVFQFDAGTTGTGSGSCAAQSATAWPAGSICGVEALFGQGTQTTPTMYDGAFDHIYQAGAGNSGYLWACPQVVNSEPRLAAVILQSSGSIVPNGEVIWFNTSAPNQNIIDAVPNLTSASASCSPVTEIYDPAGSGTDYIFLSVSGSSSVSYVDSSASAQCATGSACLYNFIVGSGGLETTPSKAYAGIAAAGGSSGIVVDNVDTVTGASQIYYTPVASSTCAGNGTSGSGQDNGTGGCAVQTSQSVP